MDRSLVFVRTPEPTRPPLASSPQSPLVRFIEAVELRARADAAKVGARAGGDVAVVSLPLAELLADGLVAVCELVAQKLGAKLIDRPVLIERAGRIVDALLSFWIHEHFGDDVDGAVDAFLRQAVDPLWLALSLGLSPCRCLSFEDWKAILAPLPDNAGSAQQRREWRTRIVAGLPRGPQPTKATMLAVLGAPVKIFLLNALRGARDSIEQCVRHSESLRANNRCRIVGAEFAIRFEAVDVSLLAVEAEKWGNYARFIFDQHAGTENWHTYARVKEMMGQEPLRRRCEHLLRLRAVVDSWSIESISLRGVRLGDIARARSRPAKRTTDERAFRSEFARFGLPFVLTEHGIDVLILECAFARIVAGRQHDLVSLGPGAAADAAIALVRETPKSGLVAEVVAAFPASVRRHADFAVLESQVSERIHVVAACRRWNDLSVHNEISMLIKKLELLDSLVDKVNQLNVTVGVLQERLDNAEQKIGSAVTKIVMLEQAAKGAASGKRGSGVVDKMASKPSAPANATKSTATQAAPASKKPSARKATSPRGSP
jgi:hypothetical protein